MNVSYLALARLSYQQLIGAIGREKAWLLMQEKGKTYTEFVSSCARLNINIWDITGSLMARLPGFVSLARSTVGNCIDSNGVFVTRAVNAARFDHGQEGQALGLLVEPLCLNEVPYSTPEGEFSGWAVVGGAVAYNSVTAPDGSTTGVQLTCDDNLLAFLATNCTPTSNGTYYVRVYVQPGDESLYGKVADIGMYDGVAGVMRGIGQLSLEHADHYHRFEVPATGVVAGNACILAVGNLTAYGGSSNLEPGDKINVWGAQVSTNYGSLVLTSGSPATRQPDVVTLTDTSRDVEIVYDEENGGPLTTVVIPAGNQPANLWGHWKRIRQL